MPNTCPACGAINRDTARFCQNCRQPFPQSVSCPACQALNTATARFCQRCGAGLTAGAPTPVRAAGMLSPGTVLAGRYRILAKIGQGGMGAVYKATDTRLGGKVVAVKELSESGLTGETERLQASQAFEREAALLSQLDHPNLPRVSDHFRENGRQYLTMDFIDGQTLADVIEATKGPLDAQRVLGWAEQLCAVLEYLHSQQPPIIFRDLKPGNIMLDRNGTVKLIDFGIARLFKAGKASDTTSFGTVGYAPPEQYGKGQTDARSDIYALGATLHHLLTGHDPGDTPFTFPPLRDLNPKVPSAVEKTILKAVQQDPTQRFQNARQMRAAFTAPAAAAPQPVAAPVPIAPPQKAPMVAPTKLSAPVKPTPTGITMTGGGQTLMICGVLAGLSWLSTQVLNLYGISPLSIASVAVGWVWLPLAYILTRRAFAVFLTGALVYLVNSLRLSNFGIDIWSLAPAVALMLLFMLRGAQRPTFGALTLLPVVAQAIDLGVTYLRFGSNLYVPPEFWVALMGGPFLGGAVAYVVGRLLKR